MNFQGFSCLCPLLHGSAGVVDMCYRAWFDVQCSHGKPFTPSHLPDSKLIHKRSRNKCLLVVRGLKQVTYVRHTSVQSP